MVKTILLKLKYYNITPSYQRDLYLMFFFALQFCRISQILNMNKLKGHNYSLACYYYSYEFFFYFVRIMDIRIKRLSSENI